MANQPMNDKKLVRLGIKKIATKILTKKANGEAPINLVRILICAKPKGKSKPEWQIWLPDEIVYKARNKDANLDEHLINKIEIRYRTSLKLKGKFIIKEIREIKFLGYGTDES